MLTSKTRWNVRESSTAETEKLAADLNIPLFIAKLLVQRGMTTSELAADFLHIDKKEFHDPFLFSDMEKAVERIQLAIKQSESILIYGDYDADGVTSTSVMLSALQKLGAQPDFYIPNRFTEGYGPNEEAFRYAAEQGYKLVITVDNGISGVQEARVLKELGVDLIITDHHEAGPEIPEAYAIIHPNLENGSYPFKELAGVGVAFKLAHALLGEPPVELMDLAAIGTIADLVPLTGENRLLVKKGLKQLRTSERKGLHALLKKSSASIHEADEETVGFAIGPRLNAVGRLSDADPAVELLMTDDPATAEALASEIDAMNKERQSIVAEISKEAMEMAESQFNNDRVLILTKEGWNPGVVGIVASKLVEKFYRPVIILCEDHGKGTAKGSARSIEGFNMFKELSENRSILPHFGGHPMAAGMTLNLQDIDKLRINLNTQAEKMSDEDFIPVTNIDVKASVQEIDLESIQQLQMLAPFGMKNPKPKVLIEQTDIASIRKIGAGQNHLKLSVRHEDQALDAIAFGMGEVADQISPIAKLDLIGELSINEWNNMKKPQLFVSDLRINEWQLFDIRGISQAARWAPTIPDDSIVVAFNPATVERFNPVLTDHHIMLIQTLESAAKLNTDDKTVVFLDLPEDSNLLEGVLQSCKPSRIYAHFYLEDPQFFSSVPKREDFAWFFAFLKKRKTFHLNQHGKALGSHKGWSMDTINFMTKVFFELDFVTINDGFITLNDHIDKRELTESPAYQAKSKLANLEQELLYSSFQDFKKWFEERSGWMEQLEEEKLWI
ncbi:single-stranded-DNA-specific exonuclease RecJ [Jeotgalibacillus salarius]|uniref:Single-stranded-DNA-specific exonuclease RecJ n=1 Tax=Jeotgalibacillus salarius TaxID=546023 RepID=A0A4Y8LFE3_9BACL|nr:single-stranded-DNA-specific exonuclease RecJ [Jeotgalibacillus salarius]TFE01053.1 single-stranded-DNA-specific exonuclease RecJ [Jeotgalibacillus salarius]